MTNTSKAMITVTSILLAIVGVITYVAIKVPMDWHGAGLVIAGYVIFGSGALACVGGTIASFFEEN